MQNVTDWSKEKKTKKSMKERKKEKRNLNRRIIVSYSFLVRYQYVPLNTYVYKILHMLEENGKKK